MCYACTTKFDPTMQHPRGELCTLQAFSATGDLQASFTKTGCTCAPLVEGELFVLSAEIESEYGRDSLLSDFLPSQEALKLGKNGVLLPSAPDRDILDSHEDSNYSVKQASEVEKRQVSDVEKRLTKEGKDVQNITHAKKGVSQPPDEVEDLKTVAHVKKAVSEPTNEVEDIQTVMDVEEGVSQTAHEVEGLQNVTDIDEGASQPTDEAEDLQHVMNVEDGNSRPSNEVEDIEEILNSTPANETG